MNAPTLRSDINRVRSSIITGRFDIQAIAAFDRIVSSSHITAAIASEIASNGLSSVPSAEAEKPLTWTAVIDQAKDLVCSRMRITRADLDSRRRPEQIAWARFFAIWLLEKYTPLSHAEIAGQFRLSRPNITVALSRVAARASVCAVTRAKLQQLDADFAALTGLKPSPKCRLRKCVHTYQDDGSGQDVEPMDECRRCGHQV